MHDYNTHSEVYAMRTNIVLDVSLIKEAITLSGARTKREVVDIALRELVARRRQRQMKDLVGLDLIAADYDVADVRRRMARDGA